MLKRRDSIFYYFPPVSLHFCLSCSKDKTLGFQGGEEHLLQQETKQTQQILSRICKNGYWMTLPPAPILPIHGNFWMNIIVREVIMYFNTMSSYAHIMWKYMHAHAKWYMQPICTKDSITSKKDSCLLPVKKTKLNK